jgi:hypothetical protein
MIEIVNGDITRIKADAIVNAANSSLMGGGGVDGAIHRAGGPEILEKCKKIVARQGRCEIGHAVITTAGKLPTKFVIHTVGPVWQGGDANPSEISEPEVIPQAFQVHPGRWNSGRIHQTTGCSDWHSMVCLRPEYYFSGSFSYPISIQVYMRSRELQKFFSLLRYILPAASYFLPSIYKDRCD